MQFLIPVLGLFSLGGIPLIRYLDNLLLWEQTFLRMHSQYVNNSANLGRILIGPEYQEVLSESVKLFGVLGSSLKQYSRVWQLQS